MKGEMKALALWLNFKSVGDSSRLDASSNGLRSPLASSWARRVGPLSLIALLGVLTCPLAEAKKLRHGPTKFSVKAPSGYKLRAYNGIYTVSKRRDKATIMKVSSPLTTAGLATSFVTTARMKRARIKGGGAKRVVTGHVRGKPVYLEIQGRGPTFKVSKYVTRKKSRRSKSAKRFETLTARDVAILRRIAGSARGGIVSPFQANIPVRRFSQGGASAVVPVLPGWTFNGVGGAIDGGLPGQGFFALGIYLPGVATSANSSSAIVNDWTRLPGITVNVLAIQGIPGTQGVLGGAFIDSATFTVRFNLNGVVYDGIMTSGVTYTSGSFFDWYYSVIAVRTGSFPGLGQTLNQTWATWDPSPNAQQRLAQTLATIRTTPVVAIDRDVFDRINSAWVEYIRR